MYRYEVYGVQHEGGEWLDCKIIVPPCINAYQASLYVLDKYGEEFIINHDSIFRILE